MIYVYGTNLAEGETASWVRPPNDLRLVPPWYILSEDGSCVLAIRSTNTCLVPLVLTSSSTWANFYRWVVGVTNNADFGGNKRYTLRVFTRGNAVGLALVETTWESIGGSRGLPFSDNPSYFRSLLPHTLSSEGLLILRGLASHVQGAWPPLVQGKTPPPEEAPLLLKTRFDIIDS
jgi:hypothetical protein